MIVLDMRLACGGKKHAACPNSEALKTAAADARQLDIVAEVRANYLTRTSSTNFSVPLRFNACTPDSSAWRSPQARQWSGCKPSVGLGDSGPDAGQRNKSQVAEGGAGGRVQRGVTEAGFALALLP